MKFKRSKRVEELLDLKPVTDEELEDLLNDKPKNKENNKRKKKRKNLMTYCKLNRITNFRVINYLI